MFPISNRMAAYFSRLWGKEWQDGPWARSEKHLLSPATLLQETIRPSPSTMAGKPFVTTVAIPVIYIKRVIKFKWMI